MLAVPERALRVRMLWGQGMDTRGSAERPETREKCPPGRGRGRPLEHTRETYCPGMTY